MQTSVNTHTAKPTQKPVMENDVYIPTVSVAINLMEEAEI